MVFRKKSRVLVSQLAGSIRNLKQEEARVKCNPNDLGRVKENRYFLEKIRYKPEFNVALSHFILKVETLG